MLVTTSFKEKRTGSYQEFNNRTKLRETGISMCVRISKLLDTMYLKFLMNYKFIHIIQILNKSKKIIILSMLINTIYLEPYLDNQRD